MENRETYYISYDYYDKRNYRRTKKITCGSKESANRTYNEILSKIENGESIETPTIMIRVGDELKKIESID